MHFGLMTYGLKSYVTSHDERMQVNTVVQLESPDAGFWVVASRVMLLGLMTYGLGAGRHVSNFRLAFFNA